MEKENAQLDFLDEWCQPREFLHRCQMGAGYALINEHRSLGNDLLAPFGFLVCYASKLMAFPTKRIVALELEEKTYTVRSHCAQMGEMTKSEGNHVEPKYWAATYGKWREVEDALKRIKTNHPQGGNDNETRD